MKPSSFFDEQLTAFEVLLSQSHRFRALFLLGRFLNMGYWAVNLSCQVDLVKDGGHFYFIKFLDSIDACPKQRAMAAFVLTVIVDGHRQTGSLC
ncbi:hypothetical protein ACSBR1_018901 [Camellia fascicularis]